MKRARKFYRAILVSFSLTGDPVSHGHSADERVLGRYDGIHMEPAEAVVGADGVEASFFHDGLCGHCDKPGSEAFQDHELRLPEFFFDCHSASPSSGGLYGISGKLPEAGSMTSPVAKSIRFPEKASIPAARAAKRIRES